MMYRRKKGLAIVNKRKQLGFGQYGRDLWVMNSTLSQLRQSIYRQSPIFITRCGSKQYGFHLVHRPEKSTCLCRDLNPVCVTSSEGSFCSVNPFGTPIFSSWKLHGDSTYHVSFNLEAWSLSFLSWDSNWRLPGVKLRLAVVIWSLNPQIINFQQPKLPKGTPCTSL